MKLFTRIYLLLLVPLLLTGCIKEDFADCPTGLKVYFTYEPATYARMGVDPAEVERIDLFVFDAKDSTYKGVWIEDYNPTLTPEYYMTIAGLPEGNYRFIAWCNARDRYSITPSPADFIVGKTTIKEAQLVLSHTPGEIIGSVSPIFYGDTIDLVHAAGEQTIYVPLVQHYNTINLTTEGLPTDGDTYRMTIKDNNGKYYLDHSFTTGIDADSEFTYTTPCSKDAQGQLSASLNILRLAADQNPVFEIYNVTQNKVIYQENLITLINRIEGIDYERIHLYNIHIKFTTDMKTVVTIDGWQVTEDNAVLY